MRIRPLLLPVAAAAIVLIVGLALGGSPATAPGSQSAAVSTAKTATVDISMFAFAPDTLAVRVGTRITFINHDQTAHTATALGGAFGTGTIEPGQRRSIVLDRAGTYRYHCLFHAFMTGTIKVVA